MDVVIIGAGNVATVFGRLIKLAGHTLIEVASRRMLQARILAKKLGAKANTDLNAITKSADIYIIAVSDSAISSIAEILKVADKIVVHTSGAVSKNVLQSVSNRYGVLYPLQSLRKEVSHIPLIPLLIDGNNLQVIRAITLFAESFSSIVKKGSDEERFKLHLSAVLVSNFTNHLYTLAKEYCENEETDFNILIPLIFEVANRVSHYHPAKMQTGPAVRRDTITIEKHLALLSGYPHLQKIYNCITESIQQFHKSGFLNNS